MKLARSEIPAAQKLAAQTRARALWLFALAELEEASSRPCLVLIAGLPGAGKSSLARDLADRAGFLVIRSDEVRKELAREGAQDSAPAAFGEDLYAADWNQRTYAECLRRAEDGLFQGRRVLIDASFRKEAHRRRFLEAASRWGITGCLLLCRAEPAVIRERLATRQGDASDADETIYEAIAERWDELAPLTAQSHEGNRIRWKPSPFTRAGTRCAPRVRSLRWRTVILRASAGIPRKPSSNCHRHRDYAAIDGRLKFNFPFAGSWIPRQLREIGNSSHLDGSTSPK